MIVLPLSFLPRMSLPSVQPQEPISHLFYINLFTSYISKRTDPSKRYIESMKKRLKISSTLILKLSSEMKNIQKVSQSIISINTDFISHSYNIKTHQLTNRDILMDASVRNFSLSIVTSYRDITIYFKSLVGMVILRDDGQSTYLPDIDHTRNPVRKSVAVVRDKLYYLSSSDTIIYSLDIHKLYLDVMGKDPDLNEHKVEEFYIADETVDHFAIDYFNQEHSDLYWVCNSGVLSKVVQGEGVVGRFDLGFCPDSFNSDADSSSSEVSQSFVVVLYRSAVNRKKRIVVGGVNSEMANLFNTFVLVDPIEFKEVHRIQVPVSLYRTIEYAVHFSFKRIDYIFDVSFRGYSNIIVEHNNRLNFIMRYQTDCNFVKMVLVMRDRKNIHMYLLGDHNLVRILIKPP